MPYQNRVDPFGQIVATSARGTLMGNRGCLHAAGERPLRQYASIHWLICVLDFKGRRVPMPPGHYTSLFFLDEATALAAGHRPCAECQRTRFTAFRTHWAAANPALAGSPTPKVEVLDRVLHHERLSEHHYQRAKVKRTYPAQLDLLPDGVLVVLEGSPVPQLVRGPALFPWSFAGYGPPVARTNGVVQVLTPRSTVRAIVQGYQPEMHPSARTTSVIPAPM